MSKRSEIIYQAKLKAIDELVFTAYCKFDCDYDVIRHRILRSFELMYDVEGFRRLRLAVQWDLCIMVNLLVLDSVRENINKVAILRPAKDKDFKYSLDSDFEPPRIVEIKEQLSLLTKLEPK